MSKVKIYVGKKDERLKKENAIYFKMKDVANVRTIVPGWGPECIKRSGKIPISDFSVDILVDRFADLDCLVIENAHNLKDQESIDNIITFGRKYGIDIVFLSEKEDADFVCPPILYYMSSMGYDICELDALGIPPAPIKPASELLEKKEPEKLPEKKAPTKPKAKKKQTEISETSPLFKEFTRLELHIEHTLSILGNEPMSYIQVVSVARSVTSIKDAAKTLKKKIIENEQANKR